MTYVYSSGLRIEVQPMIRLTEQKDLEDVVVRLKVHPPLFVGLPCDAANIGTVG